MSKPGVDRAELKAIMTGVIATIPRIQFSNSLGLPLAGGKLTTYLAGTTTPEPTYQDQELTIANPTTITLDSTGSCVLWLDPTKSYKFLLKNALGITQPGWPVDNISGASNVVSLAPTFSLYAKLTALAAATGAALIGFIQGSTGAVKRTLQDKLREFPSLLDFGAKGGGQNDTAAMQSALSAVASKGGTLTIGAGTWKITGPITVNVLAPLRIFLDAGAVISQTFEGIGFTFALSESGTVTLDGNGRFQADFGTLSDDGVAIKVINSASNTRALTAPGNVQIKKGTGTWKYGLYLVDVQDADLRGLLIAGDGKATQHMIGIYATTDKNPSVSWTITGADVYDCVTSIKMDSTRTPGIEGVKLVDVDMVGTKNGFEYTNTSDYSPPQIEMSSCHVNSYGTCVKVKKAIQVSVIGGLFYRFGENAGAFFEIDGVQDFSIGGGVKMSIIDPAIDVPAVIFTSQSQPCAFIRMDNLHYWANGRDSPVFKFVGSIFNVAIGDSCTKDTNGKWVDHSQMTSSKTEIRLSEGVQINTADYPDTVMTNCAFNAGVVDVSAALWCNVNIANVNSDDIVTLFDNRRPGKMYRIKSDVNNTVIAHNANINLRSGQSMALMPGDSIDLYSEQFVMREHARRAQ